MDPSCTLRGTSSPNLTGHLRRHLGHPAFRPGQEELVGAVLEGRDALGILPTGGGKSVCFQLPTFLLEGMVLVVSPLISLMEDQVRRARHLGIRAEVLNASSPARNRLRVIRESLAGRIDLLLVSPERLHLRGFEEVLSRLPLSLLAVDEAHCISQWGHDFRPAYLKIGEIRHLVRVPILALTATATPRVREEIRRRLRMKDPFRFVGSFDRPNLRWAVRGFRGHGEKLGELRRLLKTRDGATIVYASTRKSVEAIRRHLARLGLPALPYHAGLPPSARTAVQSRFLGDSKPVVAATNAFGMGIDRADVRMVVHFQLPGSLEAYYQEAGRAGRDGLPARCIALYEEGDRRVHDGFVERAYPGDRRLKRLHGHLRAHLQETGEGRLEKKELVRALGRRATEEDALLTLRVLARLGAVTAEIPDGEYVTLAVRDSPLGTEEISALRSARLRQIQDVVAYAEERGCRRRKILSYFGEAPGSGGCGGCDRCSETSSGRGGWKIPRGAGLFGRGGAG